MVSSMRRGILALMLMALALAACATLPPVKPIADLRSIAGKWEGTVTLFQGTFPYTLTIREDGSWEGTSPTLAPGRFEGSVRVSGGKALWISRTTGAMGTYILHEGEGGRVLRLEVEGGTGTATLRPAK